MISDEILLSVEKPARYIGNEINMVIKKPTDCEIRFAFCFPDSYEVGMSHLGMQILYFFMNRRIDTYCERVFSPWIDMEKRMRDNNLPLFSLETGDPIKIFDFLGFTLQYEMSFTNIINILNLSGLEILSKNRLENDPIVCAGGPCAYNPEPLADIVDFFYIGEGEVNLDKILDIYKEFKKMKRTKYEFLKEIVKIEGIYVPMFYNVTYKENGEIESFIPTIDDAPKKIKKVLVKDIDNVFYPEQQLIPLIESVHDRAVLEIFRGCIRGCRFCQAGFVYRPVREKTPDTLLKNAKNLLDKSGYEEISLVSLSTSDYTEFKTLSENLLENCKKNQINISLPSLRIDAFSLDLMNKISEVRKSSLTFAPEAGTQKLRDVVNKNLTEDEILKGCSLAFSGGFTKVKLYFMLGLPTENNEDVLGICEISKKIVDEFFKIPKNERKDNININMSTSCFVPKPFTPFQWFGQDSIESFYEKQKLVKQNLKSKKIKYSYHDPKLSFLEAVFARGDRRVSNLLIKAWELGARFDGWSEHFNFSIWEKAIEETNTNTYFYANRNRSYDEILPWDHIDIGVKKDYLINENEKAKNIVTTENCREKCNNCGAIIFDTGVCYEEKL